MCIFLIISLLKTETGQRLLLRLLASKKMLLPEMISLSRSNLASILRKYQIKLSKDVHHLLLSRQRDYKLLAIKRLVDVAVWMILR